MFLILDINSEILKQIERLANPVWIKQARQALLHYKQQHPHLFQNICLYSEVCKMISENTYRLGPRRLIQELFMDVNYEMFYNETNNVLSGNREKTTSTFTDKVIHNTIKDKATYLNLVAEQRKAELANSNKLPVITSQSNRRIVCGFNVNKIIGNDGESLSPIRMEPRSPPLTSVKEENFTSMENLLNNESSISRRYTVSGETDVAKNVLPSIKTLDSLNLSYSQNKFPIRNRSKSDPKSVIK